MGLTLQQIREQSKSKKTLTLAEIKAKKKPVEEPGLFSKALGGLGAGFESVVQAEMGLIKKGLDFVGVGKAIDYFADTPFMREAAEGLEAQAQQEGRGVVFGKADLIPINILRGAFNNPASAIPYFGELYDISQLVKLRSISEKTKAGTATPDEAKWVKDYLDNHNETVRRHKEEWGYSVGSVLQQSFQFMGEILGASLLAPVTGGGSIAGLVAKKGALKAAKEVALKITTNAAARKIFTKEIGQYALGAGIRAGIASSTRIPLGTVQRMTGSPITNDNGDFTGLAEDGQPLSEAMINSVSSALVEYSSEFTGGAFTALGVGAKTALIKAGFLKAIIKANPSVTPSLIAKVIERAGWHGTLEEWGEERVADAMFAALHAVGLSDQTFDISVKQVVDELASFALMGTIVRGAKKALGGGEKKEPTKEGEPEPPEPPDDGGGGGASDAVAKVTEQLQEGKSPAEIALELTNDMSATAARAVVAEAVLNEAQAEPEQKPSEIKKEAVTTFEGAVEKLKTKVEETKTAQEEADQKAEAQAELAKKLDEINTNVERLTEQMTKAEDRSDAKKNLKLKIEAERAKGRRAEREFQTAIQGREESTRAFLAEEVKKEGISEQDQATAIQAVMTRLATPAFLQRKGALSLREVLNQAVAAVKTIRGKKGAEREQKEKKKPAEKSAQEKKVAKKAEKEVAEKSDQELLARRAEIKKEDPDLETQEKEFDEISAELEKRGVIDETGELIEKKKTKKEEFEIGDVVIGSDGEAKTIESIGKRSVKFQGFQPFDKSTLRKLLKDGDWTLKKAEEKLLPKKEEGAIIKDDDRDTNDNRGGEDKPDGEKPPVPVSVGEKQPKDAGKAISEPDEDVSERAEPSPRRRRVQLGKRLLTQEQVKEAVESVTSVENGEVQITGEVTESILEAAGQFEPGGKTKDGRGILDEYYTNSRIVDMVSTMLSFPTGTTAKVLEPSVGTGNFLYALPDASVQITSYEINPLTARIAKIFHQDAQVFNTSFETLFIDERGNKKEFASDYDLVLGNPPYGEHRGKYLGLGEESGIKKYEEYFVKRGLDLLKEGGHLVMVLPSGFMNSRRDDVKELISEKGKIVNAFRLPNGVFEGTDIGTDIIVFEKMTAPHGATGLRMAEISDNDYFTKNPKNILGEVKQKKDRFGKMVDVVLGDLDTAIDLFNERSSELEAIRILTELGVKLTPQNVADAQKTVEEMGEKAREVIEQARKEKSRKIIETKVKMTTNPTGKTISLSERMPTEYTEAEMAEWADTLPDGSLQNPEKHKGANLYNGKWYNNFNYVKGNIYVKLEQLEKDKIQLTKEQYKNQKAKLMAVLPKQESIENISISPDQPFLGELNLETGEYSIRQPRYDDNGYVILDDDVPNSMKEDFFRWIRTIPDEVFEDSNEMEVRNYANRESVKGADAIRNEAIRIRRERVAHHIFKLYMNDLSAEKKRMVEDAYNKTYNARHSPDYSQTPMVSQVSDSVFDLNDSQRQGVGRLVNEGRGVLMYEVGFGKTLIGVLVANELIARGWAKKPIIPVPKAVTQQWLDHIKTFLPNKKINFLGNLTEKFVGDLSELTIEDGSISLITHEGFDHLGFKKETYDELEGQFGYVSSPQFTGARDGEIEVTRVGEIVGRGARGTRADATFESLGFDALIYDEVHKANHIVPRTRVSGGGQRGDFTQTPSARGIKFWLASKYIQNKMGRNIFALSATPFTNKPIEYFSIFSAIDSNLLEEMGFLNVDAFFGMFFERAQKMEFRPDGSYAVVNRVRRIKNFRQWRQLLGALVDVRLEDESISRPGLQERALHIPPNELTRDYLQRAQEIFKSAEPAAALVAIDQFSKIAFSPYASRYSPPIERKDYKKFVEDSPTILSAIKRLERIFKDRPDTTQIIYSEIGVEFFPFIRDYLVNVSGFKKEEVEIIGGQIPPSGRDDLVADIQNRFNKGEVKVLIGSDRIAVGLNLQEQTSDIHFLSLPWNYLDLKQIQGRAWRQKNKWANVRMNYYLMDDSNVSHRLQTLGTKKDLFESAISTNAQELDTSEIDPIEEALSAVSDPRRKAEIQLGGQLRDLELQLLRVQADLAFATKEYENLQRIQAEIDTAQTSLAAEEQVVAQKKTKGDEAGAFWIEKYTKEIKEAQKEYQEEIDALAEKGIDIKKLVETQKREGAEVQRIQAEIKAKKEGLEQKIQELAAQMPPPRTFSEEFLTTLIADLAEENKTFFQELKPKSGKEDVSVIQEVKEIKSISGKVVKTKKITKLVKKESKADTIEDIISDPNMAVEDKIETILKTKQAGKEFKDGGERVAGSRKEKAVFRTIMESGDKVLMREFMKKMGAEATAILYDKHAILEDAKKPDPAADKVAGVPSYIAFIKKDLLDKIPRKFELNRGRRSRYGSANWVAYVEDKKEGYSSNIGTKPEDAPYLETVLAEYPTMLKEFVEKLAEVKDFKELAGFWSWFEKNYDNINTQKRLTAPDGKKIRIESVIFGTQVSNYKMQVGGYWSSRNPSSAYERYQEKLAEKGKNKADRDEIAKDIKEWNELLNRQSWWDKIFNKKRGDKEETELRHGNFAPLDHIERSAEPIPEAKVKGETLKKDYGFKSWQLGNYMDDASSKEHIRHAIGSIEDMTNLLRVDFPALVHKTELAIAFGARGGGGFAVAHYEPSHNIINITKKRGDGSFGHEFMHFLDFKTAGQRSYAGRWSSKKDRWYRGDTLAEAVVALNNEITGDKGRKVKEFVPSDDPYISEDHPVLKWRKEGKSFEDVLKMVDEGRVDERGQVSIGEQIRWDRGRLYDTIADVYRKPVKREVDFWREDTNYYKNSKNYGGKYWSKPEEMLARAFQSYLEDKMAEAGMKNNYLTRSTIAPDEDHSYAKVYPQGEERKRINARFEAVFAELRRLYPITPNTPTEARFRAKTGALYALTEAGEFLRDLKDRLKLDFDVHFVDSILAHQTNPFTKERIRELEALGVTMDNTIALTREMADSTAPHEVVHITLANIDKIPIFRREGLTKEKILRTYAEQANIEYGADTLLEIEEEVSEGFSLYLNNKYTPRGIIAKFFRLLKTLITKFARAVLHTKGDIVQDYYDILAEGVDTESEMRRLENQGIMESFIEDGVLNVPQGVSLREMTDDLTLAQKVVAGGKTVYRGTMGMGEINKIPERADIMYQANYGSLWADTAEDASKYARGFSQATGMAGRRPIGNEPFLIEGRMLKDGSVIPIKATNLDTKEVINFTKAFEEAVEEPKFKLKEGDKRVEDLKVAHNEVAEKQEYLEQNLNAWRASLEQEIIRQYNLAEVMAESKDERVTGTFGKPGLIRFATKEGKISERGVAEVETLGFTNKEEAEQELHDYLKRKTELQESRRQLQELRKQIRSAESNKKTQVRQLREIGRKLKLRASYLNRKAFHVDLGIKRGKVKQMHLLRKRGRIVANAQTAFMISDKKAKEIIGEMGKQKIYLMSNQEFEKFMLDFSEKAEKIRATMDSRTIAEAMIQEKQYGKWENLLNAMELPSISKMNEEEANRFVAALEKHQFGDVFLTQRQLETVHRSKWGEIKTQREMFNKMADIMEVSAREMKDVPRPLFGKMTPWTILANQHPFYRNLYERLIAAEIARQENLMRIKNEINGLVRAARASRRKKMGLGEKILDIFVPTDGKVFDYMESAKKEELKKDLTPEELALADYLIAQFHGAIEYLKEEYDVKERQNYVTHIRRSFWEAMKEGGVKEAVREMFESQKENDAVFKILDEKTGEILAFEKFFSFALPRTGGLQPTKNIARATLAYFSAFSKKQALDALIPEIMIGLDAHRIVVGQTPKGLPAEATLTNFVMETLNDAKGRKIWFGTTQGSKWDIALRAGINYIYYQFLGGNLGTALANFIGDFSLMFKEMTLKEHFTGLRRAIDLPKVHKVNKQFRFFTGRSPFVELFDPELNMPDRFLKGLMVGLSMSDFQSSKHYLRSRMTEEEWNTMVISDKRLVELAKGLSRAKPNRFYVNSLMGNTTVSAMSLQMVGWAIPSLATTAADAIELAKKIDKPISAMKSKEAAQLAKLAIMIAISTMIIYMAFDDDEDESASPLRRYLVKRMKQELNTHVQALFFFISQENGRFVLYTPILLRQIGRWINLAVLFATQEKYKVDGKGFGRGDLKWVTEFERVMIPSAIKLQFMGEQERVRTKENMIAEALKTGEFDPNKIVEFLYDEQLAEREGKELKEYKKDKVKEIQKLYRLREKYPDELSVAISEIVLYGENTNTKKAKALIELERERGVEVFEQVKVLWRAKSTGLISDPMFKTYRDMRKKEGL